MTYPGTFADEPRTFRGKVSMPARRKLDLDEELSEESRLAMVCRRAAFQYEDIGLTVLPNLLRRVALELDAERLEAVALLSTEVQQ